MNVKQFFQTNFGIKLLKKIKNQNKLLKTVTKCSRFHKVYFIKKEKNMTETLKNLIKEENLKYEYFNQLIENSNSEEDLLENKLRRRQFIKDYAQNLHDYIWEQLPNLTPKECVIFDMVPYTIWNEMSEKYTTIIDKIKELHE